MGANTKIEWCDFTFNPWRGCSKVHAGCQNCYAEREAKRFPDNRGIWGPNGTRVKASDDMWRKPLKWNREAEAAGERRRVFCASLADIFENWPGPVLDHHGSRLYESPGNLSRLLADDEYNDEYGDRWITIHDLRRELFSLIDKTPHLDWLLLTKRPENVRRMWPDYSYHACTTGDCPHETQAECDADDSRRFRENVWLGTSISNQETADRMVPELLKCRDLCPVLFLSAEPLLGMIDLTYQGLPIDCPDCHGTERLASDHDLHGSQTHECDEDDTPYDDCITCPAEKGIVHGIDWVIVGGESGPGARPMHPDWARSLRDQCQAAGVPFFFKQWGQFEPAEHYWSCQADGETILAELSSLKSKRELKYWDSSGQLITSFPWVVYDPSSLWEVRDSLMVKVANKHSAGRLLDGREWSEFPQVPAAT